VGNTSISPAPVTSVRAPVPGCDGDSRRLNRVVLILFALGCLFQPIARAQVKEVRRVLIFYEMGLSSPGVELVDQGIRDALLSSPYQIELYREYLETTLFPDADTQREFRQWYIHKYRDLKPDLIISAGPSPLKFLLDSHDKYFSGVPIVFCGTSEEQADHPKLDSHFTGIWEKFEAAKTLEAAMLLQPATKHVVVIGGATSLDRHLVALVKGELGSYESKLEITYLTDFTMPQLLERLRLLPEHTVVLLTDIAEDAAGTRFVASTQSTPMVLSAASAPVFSLGDVDLGHGEVGGDVTSFSKEGKVIGDFVQRILKGERPHDIPIVNGANVYMFDWRALKRWGIRESDLPPGSVVLFREISVWERTKWIGISGLLVILALSLLSTYLYYSRMELKESRNTQMQLSGHLIQAQEKERSRLASELHDDFSQRLALLAFQLQNTAETLPDSADPLKQTLDEFRQSVSELGDDLHGLSHRLHSSTLDTLGLVSGLRALCREFGGKQGMEVDFTSEDIPPSVRPDVALCLFRITQEGLQNLKKHSGTKKAQLNVRHMGDRIFLSLRDEGMGFDTTRMEKHGLGILSMQGRARHLGGEFEIHSKPGEGTRIEVWVPLEPVAAPLNV
jgi:signal transduction histidine kinase